jgi:hypothetical protein
VFILGELKLFRINTYGSVDPKRAYGPFEVFQAPQASQLMKIKDLNDPAPKNKVGGTVWIRRRPSQNAFIVLGLLYTISNSLSSEKERKNSGTTQPKRPGSCRGGCSVAVWASGPCHSLRLAISLT